MDISVITPPALTSVPVTIVRANRRILNTSEDALLDFWIRAADANIEKECNIAMMEQTLRIRLSAVLPIVQLPRPVFKDFVSIKYTIEDEAEVIVPTAGIEVTVPDMVPQFEVPGIDTVQAGKMEIAYKAGYSDQNAVPVDLRHAVILLASHWSTSREAAFMDPRIMNVEKKIAFGVDEHVRHHKVRNVLADFNGGY